MNQFNSTSRSLNLPNTRHRCKCHYQVRSFYSKGAFLLLFNVTLASIACFTLLSILSSYIKEHNFQKWWIGIPVCLFGLLASVISGWVADARLGNYKVLRIGWILLFLTKMAFSAFLLVPTNLQNYYVAYTLFTLGGSIFMVGLVASIVTSLQLGLDQMPDASSSSITAFIAWYIFSIFVGVWLSFIAVYCLSKSCTSVLLNTNSTQLLLIVPPLCMSIILVLDFILAKSWLIIEPNSPQAIKTIYQVLKFAAKHKAPLNRSALTYWEEDVPSRMDLGKSRYGGPFTTEQVEDVKTILRLFTLSISLWFVCFPLMLNNSRMIAKINPLGSTYCNSLLIGLVTYNTWWYGMICTLINEFVIYPIFKNKFPSILKRIGLVSFVNTILNITFLVIRLSLTQYLMNKQMVVILYLTSISNGLLRMILICAMLELVCAQAPYRMRGLLTGYTNVLVLIFYIIVINLELDLKYSLVIFGVKTGISLFGFILYCLLACWYKRRVRDEDYNAQAVVEEVYDRYLSAQH